MPTINKTFNIINFIELYFLFVAKKQLSRQMVEESLSEAFISTVFTNVTLHLFLTSKKKPNGITSVNAINFFYNSHETSYYLHKKN